MKVERRVRLWVGRVSKNERKRCIKGVYEADNGQQFYVKTYYSERLWRLHRAEALGMLDRDAEFFLQRESMKGVK